MEGKLIPKVSRYSVLNFAFDSGYLSSSTAQLPSFRKASAWSPSFCVFFPYFQRKAQIPIFLPRTSTKQSSQISLFFSATNMYWKPTNMVSYSAGTWNYLHLGIKWSCPCTRISAGAQRSVVWTNKKQARRGSKALFPDSAPKLKPICPPQLYGSKRSGPIPL